MGFKLAIFASGGGGLFQAVLNAFKRGELKMQPVILISDNLRANALKRASRAGLKAWHLHPSNYLGSSEILDEVTSQLLQGEVDLILLLGYLSRIGEATLRAFPERILNIHPSLLPKFGGIGMYDKYVHDAVIRSGETETGITIHVVSNDYDAGRIVDQKRILVDPDDTAETLREKVRAMEPEFLIQTLLEIEKRGYV